MQIQIGSYSFPISEPFAEGHQLSPAEAKALNSLRADRLRNILYKRLQKWEGKEGGLLTPEAFTLFEEEAREIEENFQFQSHNMAQPKRHTLQGEILEVAREASRQALQRNGEAPEPTEKEIEAGAQELLSDPRIVEEARRRFEIQQEVAKSALSELLS